jgi:Ribbon-helix-helix protein, copG family
MPVKTKTPLVKASFNLTRDELEELREEAASRGVTVTQVLREALADRRFLAAQRAEKNKILVESPEGEVTQVIFQR